MSLVQRVYDEVADEYDSRYLSEEDLRENEWVRSTCLDGLTNPDVLDIGCGTGLVLDLGIAQPERYTGVDPSEGMLSRLAAKHGDARSLILAEAESAFPTMPEADLVVSLFGAPSYISPTTVSLLPALARKRLVLMHYEPGYLPDYWGDQRPEHLDTSRQAARALLGNHVGRFHLLNHFHVVVIDKSWRE